MNKPAMHKTSGVNKPFLLICLFTVSTLAATLWNGEVNAEPAAAVATAASPGRMTGDQSSTMPLCGMRELSLSAQCQPSGDA